MSEVSKFNGNHNSSMTEQLRAHVRTYGQEHLLEFWDQLSVVAKNRLADQIRQVDFSELQQLYQGKTIARDFAELASAQNIIDARGLRSAGPVAQHTAFPSGGKSCPRSGFGFCVTVQFASGRFSLAAQK